MKNSNLPRLVVCFAGDSGDGIQLLGQQFAESRHARAEDFSTYADYPAEIRAPPGSPHGVSAYTVQFGAHGIFHAGDEADVLIAFNPAALRARLSRTRPGGWVIVDEMAFTERALVKAGYTANPVNDGSLDEYQVLKIDISHLTTLALESMDVSHRDALRSRNMWVLGMLCHAYGRSGETVANWIATRFEKVPLIRDRNLKVFDAGSMWSENTETTPPLPALAPAGKVLAQPKRPTRTISGSQAMAEGLVVGACLQRLGLLFASYPITPASPMLHILAKMSNNSDLIVSQAEDEIAACGMAIGASYGGRIGVTATSGPGLDLMAESLGLAVALELPLVVIDIQRAGPSTGMPTKPEQSDLLQAVYGRHGESPLPVLAASSPTDSFDIVVEAVRLAISIMSPVIVLSDATIANTTQPWEPPVLGTGRYQLASKPPTMITDEGGAFVRDATFSARPWRIPGQPRQAYRIGGLERDVRSGHISYDAKNHAAMTAIRQKKMAAAAAGFPGASVMGHHGPSPHIKTAKIAILTWGSVYGPAAMAVEKLHAEGVRVDHLVLCHLAPLPSVLQGQLAEYDHVVVPEMNSGHLSTLLRSGFGLDVIRLNKIEGRPFSVQELVDAVRRVDN